MIRELPESGMDYTVVRLVLKDGRTFDHVVIDSGFLSRVRGLAESKRCIGCNGA
jgi:hypothetical protein